MRNQLFSRLLPLTLTALCSLNAAAATGVMAPTQPVKPPVAPSVPVTEPTDDDVIRVETNLIRLPARYISRDGKVLPFPGRSDLALRIGDQEIQDFEVETTSSSFTVSMLVDVSGSMQRALRDSVMPALHHFVNKLSDRDYGALVSFSDEARLRSGTQRADGKRGFFVSTDSAGRESLSRAIDGLELGGTTGLWDALAVVAQKFQGRFANAHKILFVLSDGADNASKVDAATIAQFLAETGITLFFVHIDDGQGTGQAFDQIARASGGVGRTVRSIADLPELRRAIDETIADIRSRPVISFMPDDKLAEGQPHAVRISRRSGAKEGIFDSRAQICFGKGCAPDLIDFGPMVSLTRAKQRASRMNQDGSWLMALSADRRWKSRVSVAGGQRVTYQLTGKKLERIDAERLSPHLPYCLVEANDAVAGPRADGALAEPGDLFRVDSERGIVAFASNPYDAATLSKLSLPREYFVSYLQVPLVSAKSPARHAVLLCGWPNRLLGATDATAFPGLIEPLFDLK